MSTKQILLAVLTCAGLTVSQPVSQYEVDINIPGDDCVGKVVEADCTIFDLLGKCQKALVSRSPSLPPSCRDSY
jgi:hypothetical protein